MSGDSSLGGRGGPQASLDRAAGTNQEIERRSRRTEAIRLCLAWRTDPLTEAIALPAAVGAEQCCLCASVAAREARFSNFLPTLTVLRRGLPRVESSPQQTASSGGKVVQATGWRRWLWRCALAGLSGQPSVPER